MGRLATLLCALLILPAAVRAACLVCGANGTDTCPGIAAHSCLSIHFGAAYPDRSGSPHYAGLRLGLMHRALSRSDVLRTVIDERCGLSGASVELLADLNAGPLRGASVTLLFSDWADMRGLQLAGLMTHADSVRGAQIALLTNRTEGTVSGFQFGLVNRAAVLKGIQIGLININGAGCTLPLLNIGF